MNERTHQLQKLNFDIGFFSEDECFRFQRKFEQLLQNRLLSVIEEVLNEIDIEHSIIKIKKLEINLERVPYNELENKLPQLLKNELLKKLKGVLSEVKKIPSENNEIIPNEFSDIDSLIFFLENGSLPWWSQSNTDASISIVVLFQKVLDNQSNVLIQRLRLLLRSKKIRVRLIRQLPQKILFKFFQKIGGNRSNILWDDLLIISNRNKSLNRGFNYEIVSLFMLDIWLNQETINVSSEDIINSFIEYIITNTGKQREVILSDLNELFEDIKNTSNYQFKSGFQYIENIIPSDTPSEQNNLLEAIRSIESFLLKQTPPVQQNVFENSWNLLFINYKNNLALFYRRAWQLEKIKEETINLQDEKLIQLVEVIEPVNAQYIINYAKDVQSIEKKKQVTRVGEKRFRDSTWSFILEYLLVERGSVFNKKSFLKSFLYKTAESLGVEITQLLITLTEAIEELEISADLKNDLPNLLKELQLEVFTEKQQRLRPETYFEETFRDYQTYDILQFFLLKGALPVTADGAPPDFAGLEVMLWKLIESDKKKLENVLENLLARQKIVVTKRVQEQFSPELSEAIQTSYQHLFEKNAESDINNEIGISEFTHQLIYFLERDTLISTDFKSIEEFVNAFVEKFPEELDMLIQRFPKESYQKILSLISKEQRQKFKRKSFALTAKERWNQTSEQLKKELIDWVTTAKKSIIFSVHILEETARDLLEVQPDLFNNLYKRGLKNKVVRQYWAKEVTEATLSRWAHFHKSLDFKDLHEKTRKLIETLRKSGFTKSRLLDFKVMQWEFIFEVQSKQLGTLNLYSLTKLFLAYVEDRFSISKDFSKMDFIEQLKTQIITIDAKDQLVQLQNDLSEESLDVDAQIIRSRQIGRDIQLQKKNELEYELSKLKETLNEFTKKVSIKKEIESQLSRFTEQKESLEKKLKDTILLYENAESNEVLQQISTSLFENPLFIELFSLIQSNLFLKGQKISELISQLFDSEPELIEFLDTAGFVSAQIIQQIVADLLLIVQETEQKDIEDALQKKYETVPKVERLSRVTIEKVVRELAIASFVELRKSSKSTQELIEKLSTSEISFTTLAKELPIWFAEEMVPQVMEQINKPSQFVKRDIQVVGLDKIIVNNKPIKVYLSEEIESRVKKIIESDNDFNEFLITIKSIQTQKELPLDLDIIEKVEVELPLYERRLQEQLKIIDEIEEDIRKTEQSIKEKEKSIKEIEQQEELAQKNEEQVTSRKLEPVYVNNAGLVILHPYLKVLFQRLKLTEENQFISKEAAHKAVYLLQYLSNQSENAPEHELVLNKFLCGIDFSEPIETEIELTEIDKNTCEDMLNAVITQWTALKNTTPEGLRISFFQREGRLSNDMDGWYLRVSSRAYDVLLDRLPWSYSLFKLPWMSNFLKVEWR